MEKIITTIFLLFFTYGLFSLIHLFITDFKTAFILTGAILGGHFLKSHYFPQ